MLCVLGFSTQNMATAPDIYRCVQNDGSVVIQDRRCMVTALQQAAPIKPQKRALTRLQAETPEVIKPKSPVQRLRQTNASKPLPSSNRSPYFTVGWDGFIPNDWAMHKTITRNYQQLLLSLVQFKTANEFSQGVRLSVYSNTIKTSKQGAFAQALELYHQIRDNSSLQLLDSQFKSHPHYKVFNIKYRNQKQQLMLTEFYIDEAHNDLFVITVQAHISDWQANLQLADQIISQL